MTLVTTTFSSGVISASELNTNFSDITTALDSITTANISSTAGITSTQLADRYSLSPWHFDLLPHTRGATLSASAGSRTWACDTGAITLKKATTRVKNGKSAALCLIEVYVVEVGIDTTWPLLTIKKGTTTIGGAGLSIEAAGYHYVYHTNSETTNLHNEARSRYGQAAISSRDNVRRPPSSFDGHYDRRPHAG